MLKASKAEAEPIIS